jgi:serine/threonine protein kinase
VTKWVNVKNNEIFAFKRIFDMENPRIMQNQVAILKELHNFQNIIKFYGYTTIDRNKWYLVTEWAEYGNLHYFYTNYKSQFDLGLKLRVAYDVARGLNFLRTVEVNYSNLFDD